MWREPALKIVLGLIGLLFLAIASGRLPVVEIATGPIRADARWRLRGTRSVPAACIKGPISKSQPDRLHGMVESCSRRYYGGASIP
jgi:hypothetical protein